MMECDVYRHYFRLRSLLLRLRLLWSGRLFSRLWRFEGKKGFVNPRPQLVQAGLEALEVFMQARTNNLIHAGKRQVRAKLSEQFFRRMAKRPELCPGYGVERTPRSQPTKLNPPRKLAV